MGPFGEMDLQQEYNPRKLPRWHLTPSSHSLNPLALVTGAKMLVVAVIEPHVDEAVTHKEVDPEAGHGEEPN